MEIITKKHTTHGVEQANQNQLNRTFRPCLLADIKFASSSHVVEGPLLRVGGKQSDRPDEQAFEWPPISGV